MEARVPKPDAERAQKLLIISTVLAAIEILGETIRGNVDHEAEALSDEHRRRAERSALRAKAIIDAVEQLTES